MSGVDTASFLSGATNTKKSKISYNRAMTITIDLPPEVAHSLAQKAAQEGRDIAYYLQQIAVREAQTTPQEPSALRTPGLHAGQYWIADDFDAPLPDSFWLGERVALWDRNRLVGTLLRVKGETEAVTPASQSFTHEPFLSQTTLLQPPANVVPICAACGVQVSEKVQQYCVAHPERFSGMIYCFHHQKATNRHAA